MEFRTLLRDKTRNYAINETFAHLITTNNVQVIFRGEGPIRRTASRRLRVFFAFLCSRFRIDEFSFVNLLP